MMNRLVSALLALAWIGVSSLSAIAAPGSLPSPQFLNPPIGSNNNTADTTANSQNRLSHVANVAAVAGWGNIGQPVEVDGYLTPGDGGRHRMVYDSANACGAGGHPAADPLGVICVNSTVGSGSWNIDKATPITPELFGVSASDATPAFQAAANAACSLGGIRVVMAAKIYTFAGTTSISPPCSLRWDGQGWGEGPNSFGTWLDIAATGSTANGGKSLFSLTSVTNTGTIFEDFGVYEVQPAPASGWAPTPYPVVFNIQNVNGGVKLYRINASPVYDLLFSNNSGRTEMCELWGQPLHHGLDIYQSFDTTRGTCGSIHFYPFWSNDSNVMTWQQNNGVAITTGRTDGFVFGDIFVYGYFRGLAEITDPYFTGNADKFTGGVSIGSFYADSVAQPVYVSGGVDLGVNYDHQLHFNTLIAACNALGSNSSTGSPANAYTNSGGIVVDANGIVEISADNVTFSSCQNNLVLLNTSIGSVVRLGHVRTNFQISPLINAGSTSTAGKPNDVAIAYPPLLSGPTTTLATPATSNANISIAPEKIASATLANNTTYAWPNNVETYDLRATSAGPFTGVIVQLPANPYPGQTVILQSSGQLNNLSVTSAYGVQGAAVTALAPYATVKYNFSAADATWWVQPQYTAPWYTYTPTVSAGSGSFGSGVTATGSYTVRGAMAYYAITVAIPSNGNGSAANNISASLPIAAANIGPFPALGKEVSATGNAFQGIVSSSGTTVVMNSLTNGYPGGNGYTLSISGFYAIANPAGSP